MLPNWLQSDRSKVLLGIFIVVSLISGYVYQFPFFQNCINIKGHVISYIFLGGLVGIIVAYVLGKELHFLIEKVQLNVGSSFAGMILFPLIFTMINRIIPRAQPSKTEVEIQRVDEYSQSRFGEIELSNSVDGYYVYFIIDRKPFRLSATPKFDIVKYYKGASLPVSVHVGLFGLKWVSLQEESL